MPLYDFLKLAEAFSDADLLALQRLLAQLSSSSPIVTRERLGQTLNAGHLLAVREDGELIGIGYLMPQPLLTRFVGEIQTVVVDEKYRGRGIGKGIMERLIEKARDLGIARLFLTSRPNRAEANKFYQHFGFIQYETNVYRFDINVF